MSNTAPAPGTKVVVDGTLICTFIKRTSEMTVVVETGHGSIVVTQDRVTLLA